MNTYPKVGDRLPDLEFGHITQAQVDSYLSASGDTNPIHSDPDLAASVGLAGVPVPGMLMVAEVSRYAEKWRWCTAIVRVNAQFVAPVLVGGGLEIVGQVRMVDGAAQQCVLRVKVAQKGVLSMIAEIRVALTEKRTDG